jgi:DNA-binding protein HU-beta
LPAAGIDNPKGGSLYAESCSQWRTQSRNASPFGRCPDREHGIPKSKANDMLTGMVEAIAGHLKKGRRVRFSGLGILQVRKRPARMGRNPATGEAIKIKASKKIAFRAAKDLKEAI